LVQRFIKLAGCKPTAHNHLNSILIKTLLKILRHVQLRYVIIIT